MKKTALLSVVLLLLPYVSVAETYYLKLRTSHHPEFLRIVLEGDHSVLSRAQVRKKGNRVVVGFPDTSFTIRTEKMVIDYKRKDSDTVVFYPGDFRGMKVFYIKYPDRLVIDVYLKKGKKPPAPPVSGHKEEKRKASKVRKVVIDPGHGGYESGLIEDNYREKNIVLDIARKFRVLANKGSSQAVLTRGSDRFMSLAERVTLSNKRDADIFISLHIGNHSKVVVYVPVIAQQYNDIVRLYLASKGQGEYMEDSLTLLYAMKEAVTDDFGEDMVSVRPLPYSILSQIESAALMIELPSFEDAYYVEELRGEIANTLYKGIYIYEEIKTK
jgi:N-acetylmuramoyl-L-alanine amidase